MWSISRDSGDKVRSVDKRGTLIFQRKRTYISIMPGIINAPRPSRVAKKGKTIKSQLVPTSWVCARGINTLLLRVI